MHSYFKLCIYLHAYNICIYIERDRDRERQTERQIYRDREIETKKNKIQIYIRIFQKEWKNIGPQLKTFSATSKNIFFC